MTWYSVDDDRKIWRMIEHVANYQTPIKVTIPGEKTSFTSKLLKVNYGSIASGANRGEEFIIESIYPEEGNALIRSAHEVTLEFPINDKICRCAAKYVGLDKGAPESGLTLSFPKIVEIQERRREKRFTYDLPEMVSVEFKIEKGPGKNKSYELNVYDCSQHGLGILITEKDFELLNYLEKGDEIKEITFYATAAIIKVQGIVRHKSKIREGKYSGCYILGIESPDIIDSCKVF
jgi:hypothetical protein